MKINWKKIVMVVSLGISIFICAGCEGKKTTEVKENKDTLKICVESYFEQDMKLLIDAWEYFNKGLKAELVVIPGNRDEAEIKVSEIRTEILAGEGPDVFLIYNRDPLIWLAEPTPSLFPNPEKAMHTGVFLPLDSYMENARYYNPEHYNQIIMEARKTEEGQCLLPLTYEYRVSYLEEHQDNPIQMPLPSWESLVSGEAGIPSTMLRFVNYSFFDLLGEYADYENKKMLISEEELYEYVLEAIDYGKLAENGPEAEGMVWAEATCASDVLEQPSDFMQNSNSFLALPNRNGGINANISSYVGINKNTTKPSQAFSFLDLLLSDEIMTYSGFWVEEENKFKGSGVILDSFGVSVNEKEFEIWCKLLPDDTEKAFRELNSQISSVRFYSDLDLELQSMRDKCREADGDEEKQREIVGETYERMEMKLAE